MNGGTQERAERRELSIAGYVICSSASIQHRLLFSISPSTTFYKAKTRHFPSRILCEGKKKDWQTDSFQRFLLQFADTVSPDSVAHYCWDGIFCPCFKHWTRQLPAKKLHFLFDSRILSHFFFFVSIFIFPFFTRSAASPQWTRSLYLQQTQYDKSERWGFLFYYKTKPLTACQRWTSNIFPFSSFLIIFKWVNLIYLSTSKESCDWQSFLKI